MSELSSLSPYKRAFARHSRGPDYQNVPLAEGDDSGSNLRSSPAGLGLSDSYYHDAARPPVSPLSAESFRGYNSQNSTTQNTPGLSAGFPSPDLYSTRSSAYSGAAGTSLLKRHDGTPLPVDCATTGDILTKPWNGVTIFMLFLAVYTFCFSGVFLGIALAKPRWGRRIGPDGLSYSTATLLSALFSKTVELSFVAVLVATIGQILTRRAIARKSRTGTGISIAEMTMRTWILQPGLIFTHGSALKYAGPTLLGVLVLVATLAATFYTTAAEALASPKLKFGGWEERSMFGVVDTAFANSTFLSAGCQTPIDGDNDDNLACFQIDNAGQSYHNFQSYLANWTSALRVSDRESRSDLHARPKPVALVWDNTTIVGQWITPSGENITIDSRDGRLIQNVTAAMPHANLIRAARNPDNEIAQPEELEGQGEYFVRSSIPAPTLNVLCVGMTGEEVEPLIYSPNDTVPHAANSTAVDDIFGFGNLEDGLQPAPLFPHLPIVLNTVANNSGAWGPTAVYLLGTPPLELDTAAHVLCSIKMMQYPHCTTKYHAAESGGELTVHCDDDPENTMPYSSIVSDAPVGHYEANWKDIGGEWLRANALSHGVNDANASIARIVTQMTPHYNGDDDTTLNPDLPSIGEALVALAASTAIMSSFYAPFDSAPRAAGPPETRRFPAAVRFKDYASGPSQAWQNIFYVTLFAVFLINLFALVYLFKHLCTDGQVTDYMEPQNMFALAVQSPPSQSLAGSCGAGPAGDVYGKRWKVDMQRDAGAHRHPHFFVRCTDDGVAYANGNDAERAAREPPVLGELRRKGRVRSMMEADLVAESPALEQYRRLAG